MDQPEKEPPLLEWQRRLIDERLDALERDPEDGEPWEVVDERVFGSTEDFDSTAGEPSCPLTVR